MAYDSLDGEPVYGLTPPEIPLSTAEIAMQKRIATDRAYFIEQDRLNAEALVTKKAFIVSGGAGTTHPAHRDYQKNVMTSVEAAKLGVSRGYSEEAWEALKVSKKVPAQFDMREEQRARR